MKVKPQTCTAGLPSAVQTAEEDAKAKKSPATQSLMFQGEGEANC